MALHAISPKQIRALLLLLVCVPLIPTVLLVRLMVDAVHNARDTALAQAGTALTAVAYQQQLTRSVAGIGQEPRAVTLTPEGLYGELQRIFGQEVAVQITDERGNALIGSPPARALPIAQTPLGELGLPWSAQLYWVGEPDLGEAVDQQIQTYVILGAVAVCGIFAIALTAALAVNRQFTLQELKSSAVATVAHELRTPIASIRMLVDTLREGRVRGDVQRQEYLELIATEALRLSRLAEHFLTFSRLDRNTAELQLTRIDPGAAAREAVRALEPRLQAPGCDFQLTMPAELPEILADRDALVTVLTNLLENAWKYSGEQKEIVLEVGADGESVRFSVRDNGLGLSKAEQRAIFEPFYQVDQKLTRAREGCGLGLSIVRRIVEAHRGRVEVRSQPGIGSVFSVILPIAASAPPVPAQP